jgi:nucleoside-diphosphate-sugar epimerase
VAYETGISHLVYVSSSNTIGFGNEQHPADERFSIQYPFSESFYACSKAESEQLMIAASEKPGQHVIIINPTFMIGAFDTKPSSGKLLLMGYKRKFMFVPKGGKNFVSARNVASAVCNALTMGRNGERYLASGINLSFKEFYTLLKQTGVYYQYIFELPDFLLFLIGKTGDLFRKFGIKTDLSSMNLRQLMIREYYTNIKARTELTFPETRLTEDLKEAIDWFRGRDML